MAASQAAFDDYEKRRIAAARTTIWATGGCVSWYQDADGVPTLYPFANQVFEAEMTADPDLSEYAVRPRRAGVMA